MSRIQPYLALPVTLGAMCLAYSLGVNAGLCVVVGLSVTLYNACKIAKDLL